MNVAGKIAIGVGAAAAIGVALAACAPPREDDPQSVALDAFGKFDKNHDNQYTKNEVVRHELSQPYSYGAREKYRVGPMVMWEKQILQDKTTFSMHKAFAAAQGNDAIASLQELTGLIKDKDGSGGINRSERNAFSNEFGATRTQRTTVLRTETGTTLDYDWDPSYPPSYGGGTSPGDDYGYGSPGYGGGTSPGDDYSSPGYGGGTSPGDGGYTSPGNGGGGTSPGDGGYTSPGNGGGSTPPSSGDSSDNGNPDSGDF